MLISCDLTATKNEIRDHLLLLAADNDHPLSQSRADKLANKFKKGLFDPELAYILHYSDPTGETAVRNIMRAAA